MGKNCVLKSALDCATNKLVNTCSFLPHLKTKYPNVDFSCVSTKGKKQTISCNVNGDTKQKTGNKRDLTKWAKQECVVYALSDCDCSDEVQNFKDITCIGNNKYTCTNSNGESIVFKGKTCPKLQKRTKCVKNQIFFLRPTTK